MNRIAEPAKSAFAKSEYGGVALVTALSIATLFAAGGVAVSYTIQFNAERKLQEALDSAVLAGTSLPGETEDKRRVQAAEKFFAANVANLAGKKGDPNVVVRITGTPVFDVETIYLVGDVDGQVYNPMKGLIGDAWLPVKVHAAATKQVSAPVCVLGLDETQKATIDFNGQSRLTAPDCAVQANSDSGAGINQVGQPMLKSKATGVTGKATGTGYEPPPFEGTTRIEDPFADLPFPPSDPCPEESKAEKIQNEKRTLSPGTYCGGLTLMAGAEVTFKPRVYVFKDGPLWLISGAKAWGDDVLFAFTGTGSTLYMNGSSEMYVTSPSTGTWKNMQFFGDPAMGEENPWGVGLVGNITLEYDGTMYFPGQNIWFGGDSVVKANSPAYALVGDKIWFQDQSEVKITQENRRHLQGYTVATGFGYGARLVE